MEAVIGGEFFKQLELRINSDYSKQEAAQLLPFARKVFDLYPLDELVDEPLDDVLGFVHSFWRFIQEKAPDTPKVRIFNPVLEQDGWVSSFTNIFVLQRDMPFLVDSIRIELNRRGLSIYSIKSTIFHVERDDKGHLLSAFARDKEDKHREAAVFLQIDLESSEEMHAELAASIESVLHDVTAVTDDYRPMLQRLEEVIEATRRNPSGLPQEEVDEVVLFLEWIRDGYFTFLGFSEYVIGGDRSNPTLEDVPSTELGLFRLHHRQADATSLKELNPGMKSFYESEAPLVLTKSSVRSQVHRQAYSDYVVVKRYGDKGETLGEYRFLGLYTSPVYTMNPSNIPLIRHKVDQVVDRLGMAPGSHDDKALRQLVQVHPRDELFHSSIDELFETLLGIWQINERRMVRLFLRPDPFEKFVSCIVYMPRDIYRTEIRLQVEELLKRELDATESEFTTYFSESILARTHFVLRIHSDRYLQVDRKELEQRVIHFTRGWMDDLVDAAVERWGDEAGRKLANRYRDAFPASYRDHFDPRTAVHDLELFDPLEKDDEIAMAFYQQAGAERNVMRFKLFHRHRQLELSELVPMLENLGFRVLGEHPYQITPGDGPEVWLHDFTLKFGLDVAVDVSVVRNTFEEAFAAVWHRESEDDAFNRLVVGARLDWRSVAMLRLYARYMKQLGTATSQLFIANTLATNLDITRNLVALFRSQFDPRVVEHASEDYARADRLKTKILSALDHVANLNEDQVLRSYLQLISATVRTNYFQADENGKPKNYISVKLLPREIPDAPEPRPMFEIFVYSPRLEGVHLRGGKVARGGIRWSDRLEDYRTEVLGLVKAQQVKNAVIVPTGAKGGFVARQIDRTGTREAMLAEGVACYQLFIRGLLDITDNIVGGAVQAPQSVIRRDEDDPYLVVAADKGTATFSDIANQISEEYGHWLGDAFASGGSHGYDHKKMGITARGAWVAVQQHFRELGLDTQKEDFTVLGIGDMGGDVFGNGMLLSEHIKLVAAFNHIHIFIDPDPDPATGFAERKRLFDLPRSSWEDYDPSLISRGGGVFRRSAKSIPLTPEIRERFGIDADKLTPNALIKALLKSEVDLIWNGGIGTYVKASVESQQEVGDRNNDPLRVNGRDLRCRVFGEGGNLGLTQRGRIEYCLNGGRCNTDFIDNSGGVDCSDHEVNIKILLNGLVASEDLTTKQRNGMLEKMTDAVAELVLDNNYQQTLAISLANYQCRYNLSEYWRCISEWESMGRLDRALEHLPDDEALAEREKRGQSLTRPELSVLVSYAKILFKEALLDSDAPEDVHISEALVEGFPAALAKKYPKQLKDHSLRREIIANQLANEVVNTMGLTYSQRQGASTGATVGEIARAYVIMRDVLCLPEAWEDIQSLDYRISAELQYELFVALMRLGRRASRWILRNRRTCLNPRAEVTAFRPLLTELQELLPTLFKGELKDRWQSDLDKLLESGVGERPARLVACANSLYFGFGVAEIVIRTALPATLVAGAYFDLGVELELDWFAEQIIKLAPASRWEDFARESFVDDLEYQRRTLTNAILSKIASEGDLEAALESWRREQEPLISRWQAMVRELKAATVYDYVMFSVALRELLDLVQATENRADLQPVCAV